MSVGYTNISWKGLMTPTDYWILNMNFEAEIIVGSPWCLIWSLTHQECILSEQSQVRL